MLNQTVRTIKTDAEKAPVPNTMIINGNDVQTILEELLENSGYFQLNYNIETGETWSDYVGTQNTIEEYDNPNIINLGNITSNYGPYDLEGLIYMIRDRLDWYIGENLTGLNIYFKRKKTNNGYQYRATVQAWDDYGREEEHTGQWSRGYGYDKKSTAVYTACQYFETFPILKLIAPEPGAGLGQFEDHLRRAGLRQSTDSTDTKIMYRQK